VSTLARGLLMLCCGFTIITVVTLSLL